MAADEAPTPAQLIQQWRDEAKSTPDAGYMTALEICAEQLEEALRPRVLSAAEVARLTDDPIEEWERQAGVDGY